MVGRPAVSAFCSAPLPSLPASREGREGTEGRGKARRWRVESLLPDRLIQGIESPEKLRIAIRHTLIHDVAVHHPQLLPHSHFDLRAEPGLRTSLPVWNF